MKTLIEQVMAARDVSTPLIAISTPDQPAIISALAMAFNGTVPVVGWDRARGMYPRNKEGSAALEKVMEALRVSAEDFPIATAEAASAFRAALLLPRRSVLLAQSVDRFWREHPAGELVQAVLNLRDACKTDQRTIIMTSPDFDFPPEIQHDVILLEDPLPDSAGYAEVVQSIHKAAHIKPPTPELLSRSVLPVRGLSAFEAEQVLAMALSLADKQDHIDLSQAWKLKQVAVSKIRGLTMTLDGPNIEDLRGLDQIIRTLNDLWSGPMPPELVLRVDEIDKSLAGLGSRGGPSDNTGVSQDLLQQFLVTMEDCGWLGAILVGIRGSGKTILTQSIGKAHGVPTLAMDSGQMKGSLVGQSEQAHREAFRTAKSIGGDRVIVLATCNKLDVLPAELLRRFKLGIYYFDLLTKEERDSLWPVYLKKYGHDLASQRPDDEGWTGAEIRNCCELAYMLRRSVKEVGESDIVPITRSDPETVASLRQMAHNRFKSVSYPGVYRIPGASGSPAPWPTASVERKLDLKRES